MRTKIALTGAHGTGKTTLCRHLEGLVASDALRVCREMPRVITDHLGDKTFFQRANNRIERQLLLFTYQCIEESRLADEAHVVICDRTVLDHLSYTIVLFPEFKATPEYQALQFALARWLATYDHIFYVPIEFAVVADGVREDDIAFQRMIDEALTGLYAEFGVEPTRIGGSVDERASQVITSSGLQRR